MKTKVLLMTCFLMYFLSLNNLVAQKLSKELEQKIEQADSTEFIRAVIAMPDKLSVSELTALAQGKSKLEARKAITARIKDFASLSQKAVLDVLKIAESAGEIKSIRSIQVVNKIVIEAKKSLFSKLQNRNDIRSIYRVQILISRRLA